MSRSIYRRQFSIAAALALLAGATITIGCGGGSSNPNSSTPAPTASQGTGSIVGSVSKNHPLPHVAVITAAQLSAGVGLISVGETPGSAGETPRV